MKSDKSITSPSKTELKAYGLKYLLPNNKKITKLKKNFKPSNHGNKVWSSNWVLIDFINESNLITNHSVLEIGCGWGMCGIFCAKKYNVTVTGIDMDCDVEPYVELHSKVNNVKVDFLNLDFNQVKKNILKNVDIVIGSDICFCDSLIDPLRRFIQRAKNASVRQILISDPGRWPFDDLAELYLGKKGVELIEWRTNKPFNVFGKILKIEF